MSISVLQLSAGLFALLQVVFMYVLINYSRTYVVVAPPTTVTIAASSPDPSTDIPIIFQLPLVKDCPVCDASSCPECDECPLCPEPLPCNCSSSSSPSPTTNIISTSSSNITYNRYNFLKGRNSIDYFEEYKHTILNGSRQRPLPPVDNASTPRPKCTAPTPDVKFWPIIYDIKDISSNPLVRIGYTILVHDQFEMFVRLFRAIYQPYHAYAINVHDNAQDTLQQVLEYTKEYQNVEVISYRVCYASADIINVDLELMWRLFDKDPALDFVINLR
eukprot:TRINITY_DN13495_c0_g2_i2.p1 TRINITY_DN13495_c0_g2~~TRINITY_DN13495_c0_g2_i2.p1  ORF type:complete len:275 (+),score=70.53 TRINITY_DN13495_c0_g2_i2:78-902(+)